VLAGIDLEGTKVAKVYAFAASAAGIEYHRGTEDTEDFDAV